MSMYDSFLSFPHIGQTLAAFGSYLYCFGRFYLSE